MQDTGSVFQIAKLTFDYDPEEDRLRIASKDAAGRQLAVWLTRHLLSGLLPLLRDRLEAGSHAAQSAPAGLRESVLALEHAAVLQRSRAAGDSAPVRVSERPELITRIDLQRFAGGYRLIFFKGATAIAALSLGQPDLHQFMAVLTHQARRAGWVSALDLGWLGEGSEPATSMPSSPGRWAH